MKSSIFQPDGETLPRVEPIGQGKDPWEKVAYQVLPRSVQSCMPMRISAIRGALRRGKFDGIMQIYHHACRYYAGDPKIIRDAIQSEFEIPVLVLEAYFYDSRCYNTEQLKTRIEAFAEVLKAKKA